MDLYEVEGELIEATSPLEALIAALRLDEIPEEGDLWDDYNCHDMPPAIVSRVDSTPQHATIWLRGTMPDMLYTFRADRRVC